MKRAGAWMLGLVLLSLVLGGLLRSVDPAEVVRVLDDFKALGWVGGALFVVAYAACVVLMVPGTLPNLAAGIVYGVGTGSLLVTLGATLGSGLAFLIGRFAMRDFIKQRFLSQGRFRSLDRAVGERGLKVVALLRLSPLMPYNILNYTLGVTRIRLGHFLLGGLAIVPSVVFYVALGSLAGAVALHPVREDAQTTALRWALQALGLFAAIALTIWAGQRATRELAAFDQADPGAEPPTRAATPPAQPGARADFALHLGYLMTCV